MKKIWIICFMLLGGLCSCEDFLDISSSNEIVESDLYSDVSGVRMAVNGIYNELSTTTLYGKNMTWGFYSVLGHDYVATSSTYLPSALRYSAAYEWEVSTVMTLTADIWEKSYNVIASCNNIIKLVSAKDSTFFEFGAVEKNMILGEMYGVRALLHFEIYRLFAPAPITNSTGAVMPYVSEYPTSHPKHISADSVEAAIIRDMEAANTILAQVDTVSCRKWYTSYSSRLRQKGSWTNAPWHDFFSYRGHRMNYYGTVALLARMHMYFGNETKAYEYAWHVVRANQRNWYQWTSSSYIGGNSNVDYIYPKKRNEIIMAFFNQNNYDNWESTVSTSLYYFQMREMDKIFEGETGDYRYVGYYNRYNDKRYITWSRPQGTSYTATNIADTEGPYLPVVSFPEMYHITIECLLNKGEVDRAVELFNTLRVKRGIGTKLSADMSVDALKEKLYNDIIREGLTMGQTFFMYKRLQRNIFGRGTEIIVEPNQWTIPLPDSETAYQ